MSKHTPGPWKIEDPLSGSLSIVVGESPAEWRFIADVHIDGADDSPAVTAAEGAANADLICAAPDLVDALEAAVRGLEAILRNKQNLKQALRQAMLPDSWLDGFDAKLERAQKALRKAGRLP